MKKINSLKMDDYSYPTGYNGGGLRLSYLSQCY